jgi:hypothetical protein
MRSRPQPKTPWRLEIALAASLLIALLAVVAVDLQAGSWALDKSSPGDRSGTERVSSNSASSTRPAAPRVGLISPPGSETTCQELREALDDVGFNPKWPPLKDRREIDAETLSRFDVLFLVSFDDIKAEQIPGSFDWIKPLSDFVRHGGTLVASTSWTRTLFTSEPFQDFAEALDYPIRPAGNYPGMRKLGYERQGGEYRIARFDLDSREWIKHTWSFFGERTPNLDASKLPKRGVDVWCYSISHYPYLPIVVSKPLGEGFVYYSAVGNYNQDRGALTLLKNMVEYVPPWRRTANGKSTGERSATHQ